MRRFASLLACLLLLGLTALTIGPAAFGKGKPSAGDNQYVDPLSSTTTGPAVGAPRADRKKAKSSTTTSTTAPATTTPTSSLSPTPPASISNSSTTTSSTTSATKATSGTLPFTGLNVGACIALGCMLLLGGLALRRVTARPI